MSTDPYCYPGSNVLKNHLGIQDAGALHEAEAQVAAIGLFAFGERPLPKHIDEARLKATHHAIFHQLYPFAGEYRQNTGTMTKGRALGYQVTYGDSRFVPSEMARIFAALKAEQYLQKLPADAFAARLAFHYTELDATHPFREGNSRTLRQFSTDLAHAAGYPFGLAAHGER